MSYRRKILEAKKINRNRRKFIPPDIGYSSVNRQCLKKMGYASERQVLAKINAIAEEGRRRLRYYECPLCELYHISHKAMGNQVFVS